MKYVCENEFDNVKIFDSENWFVASNSSDLLNFLELENVEVGK